MPPGWASVVAGTRRGLILGLAPPPSEVRRDELADFLRRRRAEVSPESVGIERNGVRRTPGLRREEVAQLAGVGLSWYTWLEQGRDITPSAQVLDALARVLRLSPGERGHLFALARVGQPLPAGEYPREAPPELAAIVAAMAPYPAYLIGPRADVLAWNRGATALFGTPSAAPDGRPNLLWWFFTEPGPHGGTWDATGRNALARFRADHARRIGDPDFAALIEALEEASPRFRALWPRHEVLMEQLGTKVVQHPDAGELRVLHLQSSPTSHPDLRLAQYVPADDVTRTALAELV